jgi:hypothetical protein
VLPLQLQPGTAKNDPKLALGTPVPPGVAAYGRGRSTDID